jgi:multimeric flavodoxin WrbA
MKVIGICGSQRKGGNCEMLLKSALAKAREKGAETEFVGLYEKDIEFCDGCCKCDATGSCEIEDDMKGLIRKILAADAVIFATPTYFGDVSGTMKNFIDRLNPAGIGRKMKGKKVCIIAVGAADPMLVERSIETVKTFCKCQLMDVVATMQAKAYKVGEIEKGKFKEAEDMGERIVSECKK